MAILFLIGLVVLNRDPKKKFPIPLPPRIAVALHIAADSLGVRVLSRFEHIDLLNNKVGVDTCTGDTRCTVRRPGVATSMRTKGAVPAFQSLLFAATFRRWRQASAYKVGR